MYVLVVYAHPNPESFNHAILDEVVRGLSEANHEFTVIDLYGDRFDPVLVINRDQRRTDMQHDPDTADYRALLKRANHLIFIYPVWWYGTPAILKGFFDRVFASGFAFEHNGMVPKGLLGDKSAWVFYTIDSPGWYSAVWRRGAEWVAVRDATLRFCGIRKVKRFTFRRVKGSSQRRRELWLEKVHRLVRDRLH